MSKAQYLIFITVLILQLMALSTIGTFHIFAEGEEEKGSGYTDEGLFPYHDVIEDVTAYLLEQDGDQCTYIFNEQEFTLRVPQDHVCTTRTYF